MIGKEAREEKEDNFVSLLYKVSLSKLIKYIEMLENDGDQDLKALSSSIKSFFVERFISKFDVVVMKYKCTQKRYKTELDITHGKVICISKMDQKDMQTTYAILFDLHKDKLLEMVENHEVEVRENLVIDDGEILNSVHENDVINLNEVFARLKLVLTEPKSLRLLDELEQELKSETVSAKVGATAKKTTMDQDKQRIKHFIHTASVSELKEFIVFLRGETSSVLLELADLAQAIVNACERQDQEAGEVVV